MNDKVAKIERHLRDISKILEIEPTESNKDTPKRVAKMWCNELFIHNNNAYISLLEDKMTVFPNKYGDNLIISSAISFSSTCEHHWLPFMGKAYIGYVPNEKVIGLSKIPRVVKYFSQKPQLQEQLSREIGEFLCDVLEPLALYVVLKAIHTCVCCRGAESDCSTMTVWKYGEEKEYDTFIREVMG